MQEPASKVCFNSMVDDSTGAVERKSGDDNITNVKDERMLLQGKSVIDLDASLQRRRNKNS